MTGLPALLASLGLVGVLFALISFVMLLLGATGIGFDTGFDWAWILGNAMIGLALLVAAGVLSADVLRERMSSGEARRASRYGSSAIASTLLAVAILGMLGFLGSRYHHRFDWSEAGVHTLSEQSQNELSKLDTDVEVLVLVSKIDEARFRDLLDRFAYQSDRFVVEYADPNVRPALLEQYGITPDQLGQGLVRIAIAGDSVEITELSEENVTNALVKLTRTGEKVVYFLEGHGERAISGEAGDARDGYVRANEALRNENYRVESLLLASVGAVPEDADVVVVPGARRPLLDVEEEALEAYLARGGAVFALVDPYADNRFVERLRGWGVELGDDIVIDRTLALFGQPMTPLAGRYDPVHEITAPLREATMFHEVRSVQAADGADFTTLVYTGDASWAESDFERMESQGEVAYDEDELQGPVPIAVAGTPIVVAGDGATAGAASPRLAVFGDADFASNQFIESYRNRDLFVNTVNWLIGDVEAISVRPNRSRASRFQLSSEQFRTIRILSLFALPELIAVLGVFTWWSRRNPTR